MVIEEGLIQVYSCYFCIVEVIALGIKLCIGSAGGSIYMPCTSEPSTLCLNVHSK